MKFDGLVFPKNSIPSAETLYTKDLFNIISTTCVKIHQIPYAIFETVQLKILRTWIKISVNSFLGEYHEMKMGRGALEIISCTKI